MYNERICIENLMKMFEIKYNELLREIINLKIPHTEEDFDDEGCGMLIECIEEDGLIDTAKIVLKEYEQYLIQNNKLIEFQFKIVALEEVENTLKLNLVNVQSFARFQELKEFIKRLDEEDLTMLADEVIKKLAIQGGMKND